MSTLTVKPADPKTLTTEDLRLIQMVRDVQFGEITVKIRNGKPVIVEKGVQTVKLEG